MTDGKICVQLQEPPKVYVVEMTEIEYHAVINCLALDGSIETDALYTRMSDAE